MKKWDSITLKIKGRFHSQMPHLKAQFEGRRSNQAQAKLKKKSFINPLPSTPSV